MFIKNFLDWFAIKPILDKTNKYPVFSERDIWWCSIGVNIGTEIDGKNLKYNRPVLVLKKFNSHQFWGLPVSTRPQTSLTFYFKFLLKGKKSWICLSQLKTIDAKRLNNNSRIERINKKDFELIKNKVKDLI